MTSVLCSPDKITEISFQFGALHNRLLLMLHMTKNFAERTRIVGLFLHNLREAPVKQYGKQLRANGCGQLAVGAFSWIFLHILCLYFQWSSLHEGPTVDKAAFVESAALQAAVCSAPCLLSPASASAQKKGRTKKKKERRERESWNFQRLGSLGYCLESVLLQSFRKQLKLSRTHLSTVRT